MIGLVVEISYCVFLSPNYNLILWSSKKQLVVARSSTEADCIVLANITTELSWLIEL